VSILKTAVYRQLNKIEQKWSTGSKSQRGATKC